VPAGKKTKKTKRIRGPRKDKPEGARPKTIQQSVRPIDAAFKTIVIAAEPPVDSNPAHLDPTFRSRLDAALAQLSTQGNPFRFVEGFRTADRQQWLYGSGRPSAVPYGRPGPILTNADGANALSKHQGNGTPGTGEAADCYPLRNGTVYIPPSTDPIWNLYAAAVVAHGLVAGRNFPTIKDSPHCELP
jgi:hypothetical protein